MSRKLLNIIKNDVIIDSWIIRLGANRLRPDGRLKEATIKTLKKQWPGMMGVCYDYLGGGQYRSAGLIVG